MYEFKDLDDENGYEGLTCMVGSQLAAMSEDGAWGFLINNETEAPYQVKSQKISENNACNLKSNAL